MGNYFRAVMSANHYLDECLAISSHFTGRAQQSAHAQTTRGFLFFFSFLGTVPVFCQQLLSCHITNQSVWTGGQLRLIDSPNDGTPSFSVGID